MKRTILVVDDDKSMRDSIATTLERKKYEVLRAADAATAAQMLDQHDLDVVLSDIRMPGLSGHELLREAKKRRPDVEIILMTAFATVDSALEAMRDGAFDYLTKPIEGGPDAVELLVAKAIERKDLRSANRRLTEQLEARASFENIVGKTAVMQGIFNIIEEVAKTDVTVMVTGESGTGKELVAQAIHFRSSRKPDPFIVVDCGSIPGTLLESELFGFEKGAFTGAFRSHHGKFELADKGTMFLDEIGNMDMALQSKLLRVLQEKTFSRLGDEHTHYTDVRIVAATNRDLQTEVKAGRFREDLFFRLNVVPIHLPPLRERRGDIPLLISHLAGKIFKELGVAEKPFSDDVLRRMLDYDWPGNIRELENGLKYMIALSRRVDEIGVGQLPPSLSADARRSLGEGGAKAAVVSSVSAGVSVENEKAENDAKLSLTEIEKRHISKVLISEKWNISRAAHILGINRTTLYKKMDVYNLRQPGQSE